MRKRAEKAYRDMMHYEETDGFDELDETGVKIIEAELTAAVKEEREKWRTAVEPILELFKPYPGDGKRPAGVMIRTKLVDALAALLTEEK